MKAGKNIEIIINTSIKNSIRTSVWKSAQVSIRDSVVVLNIWALMKTTVKENICCWIFGR